MTDGELALETAGLQPPLHAVVYDSFRRIYCTTDSKATSYKVGNKVRHDSLKM